MWYILRIYEVILVCTAAYFILRTNYMTTSQMYTYKQQWLHIIGQMRTLLWSSTPSVTSIMSTSAVNIYHTAVPGID